MATSEEILAHPNNAGRPPVNEWGHSERVQAIQNALASMPHNQTPVGIGFKLTHSPTNCLRCRADIALLEISTILQSEV